ncbi:carotenoid oxygenase family protein [Shewanella sp. JM162201]|uniref:Carotenoid oxygenase family protein n=1 Tax=Shewanella jiangmenensis TaxID=2837387 RepID=A0ABS5V0J3_9GAMM|nr:carotenoid oxygenase family protein [Shewanella jiangmenensis]MBT1443991.1 carotenoid oxygenase family protein [Shewanella jiangmenensis]
MQRREFLLKGLAAFTATALMLQSRSLWALQGKSYAELFDNELKKQPVLKGWQGLSDDIAPYSVAWEGKLPAELYGTRFYRNGPGLQCRAGERYQHWFDGDGFINQFTFGDRLSHQGRFVRTAKFEQESRAGHFLYNGAGSHVADAKAIRSNETINTANTALLPLGDEILALWEAGAPYSLDSQSLETKGAVSFAEPLTGVPFSAHPHKDRQGFIWNFGDLNLLGYPGMMLYQLDSRGKLLKYKTIPVEPGYVHDFVVTDNYLMFYLPPIKLERGGLYLESLKWQAGEGGRLLLVDKNSLTISHEIPFEPGFVFHFGNGFELAETGGGRELCVSLCWYPNADVMLTAMQQVADPAHLLKTDKAELCTLRINLNTFSAKLEHSGVAFEFIQFDKRESAAPGVTHYGVSKQEGNIFNGLTSVSQTANGVPDKLQHYRFGDGVVAEEPLYLPSAAHGGYLINTSLDYLAGKTHVNVFVAERLSDGPIARATLKQQLPLGFHGAAV